MRTVKFEDLEPGMLVDDMLVVNKGEAGTDELFGDNKHIRFFSLNDSYYGQCSATQDKGQIYKVTHEIGSNEYRKVIHHIISERVECASHAESDIDLLHAYSRISPK